MYFCQKRTRPDTRGQPRRTGHRRDRGLPARPDIYTLFAEPQTSQSWRKSAVNWRKLRLSARAGQRSNPRGKSVAWALEADDKLSARSRALKPGARANHAASALGPDRARPGRGHKMGRGTGSTRREVAQIILSPGHLGVMKVQRGRGIPAYKRVTWVR